MSLSTTMQSAGRVYKTFAPKLEKLGIITFEDMLYHIPSRYEDTSLIVPISSTQPGEKVTLQGKVTAIKNQYLKSYKTIQKATLEDSTGEIELTWFNQPFLTRVIIPDTYLSVSGIIELFGKTKKQIIAPEYESITTLENPTTIHTGRIVPVYPETRGITSKWIRKEIYRLLFAPTEEVPDFLPPDILQKYHFSSLFETLQQIHFPSSIEQANKARERLSFDEFFLIQLAVQKKKQEWKAHAKGNAFDIDHKKIDSAIRSLPFTLTDSQQEAVGDILKDIKKPLAMNRLIQGDVGSGKTVVGAIAMYVAYLNGFQSVFMAPTQILAEQHYETIKRFLEPLGVKVELVTGNKKFVSVKEKGKEARISKEKRQTLPPHDTSIDTDKPNPLFHVLVGTHAVLSKDVRFDKLGLVIIDEQQRFGVKQRGVIREKGDNPHVLTMTATPIPRTVALTMYGDLDLSYLKTLPKGRKRIKTWLVPKIKRDKGYMWIRQEIKTTDSQVFVICPFIEESESMSTVKAANTEYERLKKEIFPDLKVGLLHGKMKAKDKNDILGHFRDKKYDILVATPVVEVGIDIPNATIILIEASERFGLSSLHQLRGRVGRGEKQSYCLLFTESDSDQTIARLKSLETIYNGAELAELDLKLRGSGDMYGTKQHGIPSLKVASFSNFALIQTTRQEAEHFFPLLKKYPELEKRVKQTDDSTIAPD